MERDQFGEEFFGKARPCDGLGVGIVGDEPCVGLRLEGGRQIAQGPDGVGVGEASVGVRQDRAPDRGGMGVTCAEIEDKSPCVDGIFLHLGKALLQTLPSGLLGAYLSLGDDKKVVDIDGK